MAPRKRKLAETDPHAQASQSTVRSTRSHDHDHEDSPARGHRRSIDSSTIGQSPPPGQGSRRDDRSDESASTIRILIASDNHIGYAERDPVRGDDSFKAFEEVMALAKERDVDMVLLGGDLFHENKPSRKSMYSAMRSLRLNCLGDKPCELEILGDQAVVTEDRSIMHINYDDPDINVAIPVFSIHGNHDDPSGEGHLCALDIIQCAGLINYYGRVPESNDITVKPVLLQKGSTKLALYGLSNVRDERLFRSFRDGNVRFLRPELYQDEWFNLIALHQNHAGHTETGYLPENFLQNFFDFVVWGHEHECLIDPIRNAEQDFYVCQPGSSVATSLSPGEAVQKHVGILSVRDREWKMEKIALRTVRPFVIRDVELMKVGHLDPKSAKIKSLVIEYLSQQVEEMIEQAADEWLEAQGDALDPDATPPLPLIRLRVDYTAKDGAYELENPQRFSQRFLGRVANATDVLHLHQKKRQAARRGKADDTLARPDLSEVRLDNLHVASLVKQYLETQKLQCLPENDLEDAVTQFVEKGDKEAVRFFVTEHLRNQVELMVRNRASAERINEEVTRAKEQMAQHMEQAREQRRQQDAARVSDLDSDDDVREAAPRARAPARSAARQSAPVEDDDEEDDSRSTTARRTRTTRAPAKRKTPARRAARRHDEDDEDEQSANDNDDDSIEEPEARPRRTPARATRPAARAAAKSATSTRSRAAPTRQSQLTFAPSHRGASQAESIEIIDDDDDGFTTPMPRRR